ncbi:MAG: EVE domain-containing protein [Planctomycetota bacterium]|nr:MAG: EVE domain-containing protein [Planctomycetota bacterium]
MAARAKRHWLVKTEPDVYSIDDLQRDGSTMWDGVRNYQARNLMRDDMKVGDPVLVYHSNAKPMCIAGVAKVSSKPYADPTAFDKKDKHFDPKSKKDDPTWILIDIAHVQTFEVPLERPDLMNESKLDKMMLLQRGSRLSVQPVTKAEFDHVLKLAKAAAKTRAKEAKS